MLVTKIKTQVNNGLESPVVSNILAYHILPVNNCYDRASEPGKCNLLNIFATVLLLSQANRSLECVFTCGLEISHYAGGLGGLQVEVGLCLDGLNGLSCKSTNVFDHVFNEPKNYTSNINTVNTVKTGKYQSMIVPIRHRGIF